MDRASGAAQIGVLGGPGTFAAQAARHLLHQQPHLGTLTYLPSGPDLWQALQEGRVQKAVITAETTRTGFLGLAARLVQPAAPFFVEAELAVPYNCALLAKPGTTLPAIRRVLGHGSLEQCRPFLARALPHAEVVVRQDSSLAAAREVASGDGRLAVVGTRETAQATGLVEVASSIDDGSQGLFWLVTTRPHFSPSPDRVLVAGRFAQGGALTDLVVAQADAGYHLRDHYAQASGQALFEYDHLLVFAGTGQIAAVRGAVEQAGARLLGAFSV